MTELPYHEHEVFAGRIVRDQEVYSRSVAWEKDGFFGDAYAGFMPNTMLV